MTQPTGAPSEKPIEFTSAELNRLPDPIKKRIVSAKELAREVAKTIPAGDTKAKEAADKILIELGEGPANTKKGIVDAIKTHHTALLDKVTHAKASTLRNELFLLQGQLEGHAFSILDDAGHEISKAYTSTKDAAAELIADPSKAKEKIDSLPDFVKYGVIGAGTAFVGGSVLAKVSDWMFGPQSWLGRGFRWMRSIVTSTMVGIGIWKQFVDEKPAKPETKTEKKPPSGKTESKPGAKTESELEGKTA